MSEEVKLILKDNYIEVEINQGGAIQNKNIEYSALSSLFQENTETYESPLLPGEYGLQKMVEHGRYTDLFYLEAPRLVNITYEHQNKPIFRKDYFTETEWGITQEEEESDSDFESRLKEKFDVLIERGEHKSNGYYKHRFIFVSPRLFWFFRLRKATRGYNLYQDRVYAMKSSIITQDEWLYDIPTSNVFPQKNVCWGSNTVSIPTLKSVQGISTFFYNAPFNSDLEGGRFREFEYTGLSGRRKNATWFFHLLEATTQKITNGESFEDTLRFVESTLQSTNLRVSDAFNRHVLTN